MRATFAIYFIWRNDLQVYSVAVLVHSSVASTSLTLAQGAPSASDSRLAADLAPRLPLVVSSATPGPVELCPVNRTTSSSSSYYLEVNRDLSRLTVCT